MSEHRTAEFHLMHEMQQSASAGSQIASRLVIFLFVVKMDVKIGRENGHPHFA